jgi:hypothetical protein
MMNNKKRLYVGILLIIIILSSVSFYDQLNSENVEDKSVNNSADEVQVTCFTSDSSNYIFSAEFNDNFKVASEMNEKWLGIVTSVDGKYCLMHINMKIGETVKDETISVSKASALYIIVPHIDFFSTEIENADYTYYEEQIYQGGADVSEDLSEAMTGTQFKGYYDVFEINVEPIIDQKIIVKNYTSKENGHLLEQWNFTIK